MQGELPGNSSGPSELSDSDLEVVAAGKEEPPKGPGFGRKLLWALWSSSGFNPENNEWWRYQ
jgi:hypothetical protein